MTISGGACWHRQACPAPAVAALMPLDASAAHTCVCRCFQFSNLCMHLLQWPRASAQCWKKSGEEDWMCNCNGKSIAGDRRRTTTLHQRTHKPRARVGKKSLHGRNGSPLKIPTGTFCVHLGGAEGTYRRACSCSGLMSGNFGCIAFPHRCNLLLAPRGSDVVLLHNERACM